MDITKNLTIQGPGAGNLSISGGDASRVFEVDGAKTTVTLSGLTITHGRSYLGGGGDFNSSSGGGILNYQAKLTVSDCTVSYNSGSEGGGIFNDGGTVTLTACTLSYNSRQRRRWPLQLRHRVPQRVHPARQSLRSRRWHLQRPNLRTFQPVGQRLHLHERSP